MNEAAAQNNWMPWIVLGAIVLFVAWKRGLLKLPAVKTTSTVASTVGNTLMDVSNLTSHEIGVLFAQIKKREAEAETAAEFAKQAGDSLTAAFKAPFVSAAQAPAPPSPPAPGV